ncbi:MAG: hypothetical protein H6621_03560 [Halobacteriovoraceae bacterium]|nr:hypothetical protein [Halobacteriovoraceae bacterium]MCB9094125.1 hypothetical protein [Halobacteriovoraceae bacterium]
MVSILEVNAQGRKKSSSRRKGKSPGSQSRYVSRAPGGAAIGGSFAGDSDKPIEVHGQTRNLNMLLKIQSEREQIDFIKLRKDYKEEIEEQNY